MNKEQILAIIDDALLHHTILSPEQSESAAEHVYIELEANGIL